MLILHRLPGRGPEGAPRVSREARVSPIRMVASQLAGGRIVCRPPGKMRQTASQRAKN